MRILGIDPGVSRIGWGVLDKFDKVAIVECGLIHPKTPERAERLSVIYSELLKLFDQYHPDCLALEKLFFNKNLRTAMAVGEAIGVICLAAQHRRMPIAEYTTQQVKEVVVGSGRAKKQEVKGMLELLLERKIKGPDDVSDAVAVALCHVSYDSLGL